MFGWLWVVVGVGIFIDVFDGVLYFLIELFVWLFLIEGFVMFVVVGSGVGG